MHIAGDLLFFLFIWPHDSTRTLVWTHGADLRFWLKVAQVLVFGALAVLAFMRLRSEAARESGNGGVGPVVAEPIA